MDSTVSTVDLGNIKTKSKRSRGWVFTLNNWTEEEYKDLLHITQQFAQKYIIGKEHAPTTGTPHLQGYIYWKEGKSRDAMKKLFGKRYYLEFARGSPKQNETYCGKDEEYIKVGFDEKVDNSYDTEWRLIIAARLERLNKEYENVVWKPWQRDVLDILETKADMRTIHWVFDPIGNSGKSYLTKYIYLTRKIIIADGKKDNVFNQVCTMVIGDKKKKILPEEPEVVLLDIPRSSEGYINYGVLEQLKNGLIYSGKYEGGICAFGALHVIVFANFLPDRSQFSDDRWNIISVAEISCVLERPRSALESFEFSD